MTMTETAKTGQWKRGAETREKLIDATVHLVAEWGPDAVNLRDIGREADQGNNSAVQFHFKTKEGVLVAAVADRLPVIFERDPSTTDRRTVEFVARMMASKEWARLVWQHDLVLSAQPVWLKQQLSAVLAVAFMGSLA
jgi:AcrR family transcriptional regulator